MPYFSYGLGFVGASGDLVAANHAAVAPPAGARCDYSLWRDLGRLLDDPAAWPEHAEDFYTACVADAGLDFARIAAVSGPLLGADARDVARDAEHVVSKPRYATASGKVELHSSLLAAWNLPALPSASADEDSNEVYPLRLITGGRHIDAFHENAQHMQRFRAQHPHPRARLNPATALRHGIADGAWMTIESEHGAVRQQAEYSNALAVDVVEADRWWYPEGVQQFDEDDRYGLWATNINVVTSDRDVDSEPATGAWQLRGLWCRIGPSKLDAP